MMFSFVKYFLLGEEAGGKQALSCLPERRKRALEHSRTHRINSSTALQYVIFWLHYFYSFLIMMCAYGSAFTCF
jgi:hypothetical protein